MNKTILELVAPLFKLLGINSGAIFGRGEQKKTIKNNGEGDGFEQYEMRLPHNQTAIDALKGWTSAFPESAGVVAGVVPLSADTRILNALSSFGSIENLNILEVGPLEGMHTYILNQHRPANIDAIEANQQCYLRCLVTKEILKIDRASFYLGDIVAWLQNIDQKYDFTIASGVLYHMPDPGEFLRLLSKRSHSIFIWTHYYDPQAMPQTDIRHTPFSGRVETREIEGFKIQYFERGYHKANVNASFCGGMKDRHYWLHREEILGLLRHFGFDDISIQDDDPNHNGGPCFSILARRRQS